MAGREELGIPELRQRRQAHRGVPRPDRKAHPLKDRGLAAAVYTQTTDVEIEVNGLMTYDRAMIKMDADRIAAANRRSTPNRQVTIGA